MTIDKLSELRESNFFNERVCQIVDLLLQAATDWPRPVSTIENFLTDVKRVLKSDNLNYKAIDNGMKKLDPVYFLWELEALSSLLELASLNHKKNVDTFLLEGNIIGGKNEGEK